MWTLGTEPKSSARAISTLKHRASPPFSCLHQIIAMLSSFNNDAPPECSTVCAQGAWCSDWRVKHRIATAAAVSKVE